MEKITPVALFAYNRPNHIRQALESLAACRRLRECRLLVFCDGPKGANDAESVRLTRQEVHHWAKTHGAEVVERETNLGLANSIVTGVSELCREHGRVIVVEDDLVVSPDFIDYMLQGLDRYEDEQRVYQISGHLIYDFPDYRRDTFFLPLTTTWGWATWDRAWGIFDPKIPMAESHLADASWMRRFDLGGEERFSRMLKAQMEGRSDSWGILWWYAVFNAQGLVLYPKYSLVWNGGFDCSGVHCGNTAGFEQTPPESVCRQKFSGDLTFPERAEPDLWAFEQVKAAILGKTPGAEKSIDSNPRQGSWTSRLKSALGLHR